jgi:hypothetical protein
MAGSGEMGRMSFDFCEKKQRPLPTAAFCFDDVCCSNGSIYSMRTFEHLEKIAERCPTYEVIKEVK